MQMTLTFKVSGWKQGEYKNKPCEYREWSGPPSKDPSIVNVAARVHRAGHVWPFVRWEWSVWSPFFDHEATGGEATSREVAIEACDKALAELISRAESEQATSSK